MVPEGLALLHLGAQLAHVPGPRGTRAGEGECDHFLQQLLPELRTTWGRSPAPTTLELVRVGELAAGGPDLLGLPCLSALSILPPNRF